MSGQIIYRPEQPHACEHPADGSEPSWTVWKCNECGDTWTAWPRSTWMRDLPDPGIPEPGYRAWRWPWKRAEGVPE